MADKNSSFADAAALISTPVDNGSAVTVSASEQSTLAAEGQKSGKAPVWIRKIRVRSSDVTSRRTLRISTLLKYIQEGTVRHTTELGMGRSMTLDKGLLWVITQQQLTIRRLPGYDEEITLKTWPGAQLHLFFPRYTSILDEKGEEIITSKTLWVLMDEGKRRPVFPQKYGVHIEGVSKPGDFPLARVALPGQSDRPLLKKERTALFSECDINGHMNNSEYFDLLDDMIQECRLHEPDADISSSTDVSTQASGVQTGQKIKAYQKLQVSPDVQSGPAATGVPCEISAEYIDEIPYDSKYCAELYQSDHGVLLEGRQEGQNGKALLRIRISGSRR